MPSIEERFSAALHGSARAWRLAIDRRLKHLGLSQASWMAIALTAKESEPPSQTKLAARAGVEDPTMVATVDRLVKAGYMMRTPSETDRRVKLLSLTPAGQEVYQSVWQEADALRRELLGNVDPEMLRNVTLFLEAIQANIESLP
ncbi:MULTISPECIES: MarR family winged helix-turn-helix transcriptional regulator [unclassified Duganella]|jgi:MarR family transcriptional regulator for hemolysin|uniref:MarR family winged helix-turn-helix transcriptional regulator n=1 Tax=unclassified Duganella TaxID=2636909 RepID=UPI00088CDDB2|nr:MULTISPECIES: MarR family transcriptional regulator [unclassified Duganella]SDF60625.1 MarR family transcriptional regulator, transcriptional regulator for hemolysin [Duganella sp. OV458]SDI68158.1 MarR family transcriptional regulator, transcriptional regulator for hemolysin [Duganella sp. OV510]